MKVVVGNSSYKTYVMVNGNKWMMLWIVLNAEKVLIYTKTIFFSELPRSLRLHQMAISQVQRSLQDILEVTEELDHNCRKELFLSTKFFSVVIGKYCHIIEHIQSPMCGVFSS